MAGGYSPAVTHPGRWVRSDWRWQVLGRAWAGRPAHPRPHPLAPEAALKSPEQLTPTYNTCAQGGVAFDTKQSRTELGSQSRTQTTIYTGLTWCGSNRGRSEGSRGRVAGTTEACLSAVRPRLLEGHAATTKGGGVSATLACRAGYTTQSYAPSSCAQEHAAQSRKAANG